MARVLVVDDERDVVDLVKFLLERKGHETTEAYDGEAGLEQAILGQPDLIIMDIMMPKMDGYTACSCLMQNENTRKIPVIVLTAKGQARESFELSHNVRFFLEKPFDPKDLQSKVDEALAFTDSAVR